MADRPKLIKYRDGGWSGVPVRPYKEETPRHRGVTRRDLLGALDDEQALHVVTRYFEICAGGYSTLERHEHAHAVVVIRGSGTLILGDEAHAIAPFDCVYVSSGTLHQFQAAESEPLGILCIVERMRDRPSIPSDDELAGLAARNIPVRPRPT